MQPYFKVEGPYSGSHRPL